MNGPVARICHPADSAAVARLLGIPNRTVGAPAVASSTGAPNQEGRYPMPDCPHVRVDPQQRFGQPAVKGVPVDAITGMVWAGESVAVVADEYGLTRPDVLVACWYQAHHGTRTWRKRWGAWAKEVSAALWSPDRHGGYDAIPDPPDRDETEAAP